MARDLKGKTPEDLVRSTLEGVDVRPLYTSSDVGEVAPRPLRVGAAAGWDAVVEADHPDPAAANAALRDDFAGGATAVRLHLEAGALGTVGSAGVAVGALADLERALDEVPLERVRVALRPGAGFLAGAAALSALWSRRGVRSDAARGGFGADPLGLLAAEGLLPWSLEEGLARAADLGRWTAVVHPRVAALEVSTAPYHEAGATSVQELAYALATGVEYLRALAEGTDLEAACRQLAFTVEVDADLVLSLAKLRAARRLWTRAVVVAGGDPAWPMRLEARTSRRVLTRRDPWGNMLRGTAAAFAAVAGGADAVSVVPFDAEAGQPDAFGRRIARNVQVLLREESHLDRTADPAGGSHAVEALTEELARAAWAHFQELERHGGMGQALLSGRVREEVDGAWERRRAALARRRPAVVGVSRFPDLAERPVVRDRPGRPAPVPPPVEEGADGAESARRAVLEGAPLAAVTGRTEEGAGVRLPTPFPVRRLAGPFEALRERSDACLRTTGARPRAFVAGVGPLAEHNARTEWVIDLLAAGGVEAVTDQGGGSSSGEAAAAACAATGARAAVISAADARYAELVPDLAPRLRQAGVGLVLLAGRPGAAEVAWREAGVDLFVHEGADVLGALERVHEVLEVRS